MTAVLILSMLAVCQSLVRDVETTQIHSIVKFSPAPVLIRAGFGSRRIANRLRKNLGVLSGIPIPSLWPVIPVPLGLLFDKPNFVNVADPTQLQAAGFPVNRGPLLISQLPSSVSDVSPNRQLQPQPQQQFAQSSFQLPHTPGNLNSNSPIQNIQSGLSSERLQGLSLFPVNAQQLNVGLGAFQSLRAPAPQDLQLASRQSYGGFGSLIEGTRDSLLYNVLNGGASPQNNGGVLLNMNGNSGGYAGGNAGLPSSGFGKFSANLNGQLPLSTMEQFSGGIRSNPSVYPGCQR